MVAGFGIDERRDRRVQRIVMRFRTDADLRSDAGTFDASSTFNASSTSSARTMIDRRWTARIVPIVRSQS